MTFRSNFQVTPKKGSPCFKNGKDCEKRKVGCRSDCPDWAIYEEEKKERYAKKKAVIDADCESPRIRRMTDMKKREIKNGRRAR